MKPLVIIPARGGSKGIPGKNIKPLAGKPLIYYTIDAARGITTDDRICVSTDDDTIARTVRAYGLDIPFMRPSELAGDTAATYDVLLDAAGRYKAAGLDFDVVILLQATSPFRTAHHIREALALYTSDLDMVVSVAPAKSNPYYTCLEEDQDGMLVPSKGDGHYTRRQDCPTVYEINGAIYIINPESLLREPLYKYRRRRKYLMDAAHSTDIDTPLDWQLAELMLSQHIIDIK